MAVTNQTESEIQVVESNSVISAQPSPLAESVEQPVGEQSPAEARRMGCLWLYLPFTVIALPIALLRPGPLGLGLILGSALVSLVVIASESGLNLGALPGSIRSTVRRMRQRETSTESNVALRVRLIVLAVFFAVASAFLYNPRTNPDNNNWQIASFFLVLTAITLGAAINLWRDLPPLLTLATTPLAPRRSNAAVSAVGVAALLLVGEINGRALKISPFDRVPYWLQAILFFGGIALVVWGLAGTPSFRLPRIRWNRETIAVLALVVIAFVVRIWNIENGLRASIDEVLPLEGVGHILSPRGIGLVSPPSQYLTTLLYSQWQAFAINIFGHNATGLRITGAVIGALSVAVMYFLAKESFDRKTAFIAAALLMAFPPHIHMSRISLLHIADPFFGLLAALFAYRGLIYNRRVDWALAGAMLGLTQYFFEAGRLFFVPLFAVWIGFMLVTMRGRLRLHWRGFVLMVIALVFTVMPTYYALFSSGKIGAVRLGVSSIGSEYWQGKWAAIQVPETREAALRDVGSRVLFPFQSFVRQPEMSVFYGGDQPMLLVYVVPFFLLGMIYLLWRFEPPSLLVVGWVVSTALVNVLMRDQAHYPRYIVGFPALTLAAAVGIRYVLPGIITQIQQERRLNWATAGLVGFMVVGQVFYYHNYHVPLLMRQIRESKPYPDTIDAALRATTLPAFTDIYMVSDPISDIHPPRAWLTFMSPNTDTQRIFVTEIKDFTPSFLAGLATNRNYAFFIEITDAKSAALLQNYFRTVQSQGSPYQILPSDDEFILYYVPANTLRAG